ncbi:MAG TPA: PKD domain-containing protein, partial [Bacteroidales bacterium]|nr:PKD domain-containing protein [Bacteroidales bacterium]
MLYCVFKKSLLIASLLILSSINNIWGQVGKEFWFAIPKETSGHSDISASNNVSFKITNQDTILPTHVTISMPAPGSGFTTREIDIAPGSTYVEIVATSDQNFANVYANPAAWDAEPIPGKTKHGVLITSTQDITVYYDYDNPNNRDLFSLKGKNALGTKFYLPFQNIWGKDGYNPDALSTSDIVATEDGTTITITPTVILKGRTDLSTFTVTLNKGETYSIVARSCNASDHFTGTYVSSDKPIAVTVNDDSTPVEGQGCYDIIGDQIIPVSVCGLEYIVMTGSKSTTNGSNVIQDKYKGEQIFVVGTAAGTKVEFFDKNGVSLYSTTVNAGGSTYISPNITNNAQTSIYIKATQPIYVLHITGIGCEMGGAIVPPITNCTGSYEVSFYRSSVGGSNSGVITLNLMIRYDTTQPFTSATQSHYHFTVYHQDGSTFNIPGTWFEPIANTGWAVLSKDFRGDVGGIGDYIFRDQPTKIVNDYDVFHLGITNGVDGNTNKYGYFSSFSAVTAGIATIGTGGSNSVPAKSHIYCYGDTVYIQATGGSGYSWHLGSPTGPKTYIANPQKGTTQVYCPPGTWSFYCIIDQAKCFGDDTLKVTVDVIPEVRVMFDAGTAAACSPFKSTITNKSIGATDYAWSYKINNGSYQVFTPPSQTSFIQPASGYFENTVSPYKPVIYTYRLLASYKGECPDSTSRQIVVYPIINANFLPTDTTSCHPALVPFRNLSNGNVVDSMYQWEFGDGNSAPDVNPIHTYKNQFGKKDTTYNVTLIARSPYNCTDTARATVKVYPYLKAAFTADTVRGCSPFTIHINNTSLNKQAISQYLWDFGDGITRTTANDTLVHTFPRNTGTTPIDYKVLLTVKHQYENGCPDTISRTVTVYPESIISFIVAPNVTEVCDSTTLSFITTSSAAISGFEWDFGDGNTSKDKSPTHMFTNSTEYNKTYHVTLTGLTKEYCNAYASTDIKVHPFLDPRFTFETPTNCAPFVAKIKNQSRGGIESYKWTYNDFTSDSHSVADTTHLFRNTTSFVLPRTIRLVVSNSGGACKDSVEHQILVNPEIKASFTPSSIIGCNPLPVTFTNKSTYPDVVSKHYAWDFGGDGTSDKRDEEHTFKNTDNKPAIYPVKLTVTSDENCTDDTIINITVYPYVEAKFTVDTVEGCSPFNINISNSSRGLVTAYQWLYDDGAFDQHSSASYSHTYYNNLTNNPSNQPLSRKLLLIASNTNGLCKSRDSIKITVNPEVYSKFITDVIEGCNPLTVKYTNQSGPGKFTVSYDYKWEYGDGGTSTTKDVTHSHTFENKTSKELPRETRLIATSMYKCTDTAKIDIKVYPFIDADFWFRKPDDCSPYSLTLNNSSLGGPNGFEWIFGDGFKVSSNAPLLSHTYRNLDNRLKDFYPQLVASYNGQCQDTATEKVTVYPEVTAQFTQDTLKGCHPLTINITNQSKNGD